MLYPNKLDGNNRIQAGKTINLPNQTWQIKAAGPAGVDHILVLVADSERDLKALEALGADKNSPFVYALNNPSGRSAVINYLTGFFGGLMAVMMSILPVTILWYVLTGGDVWGMDVITNLTALVNMFGTGGFTGLVVLVMLAGFFVKK